MRLDKNILSLGFIKGNIDRNIYLRKNDDGLLIVEVFGDEIIFGGDDEESKQIVEEMKKEIEMSMISEMKYFSGL